MASVPIYRTSDGAEDALPFLVAVATDSSTSQLIASSQHDASPSSHGHQITVAFESLADLRHEISQRLDIPDEGLVLFVSGLPRRPETSAKATGAADQKSKGAPPFAEQLGERAFEVLCEHLETRRRQSGERNSDDEEDERDDERGRGGRRHSDALSSSKAGLAIWCFDRDSFASDPVTFSASLEESLVLAEFLPRSPPPPPPPLPSAAGPSRWDRSAPHADHSGWQHAWLPFEAHAERAEELVRATRVQARALEVATENLGLHLDLLRHGTGEELEGKEGAQGEAGDGEQDDSDDEPGVRSAVGSKKAARRRLRRKAATSVDVAGGESGSAGGWTAFARTVQAELEREARLVGGGGGGESSSSASATWGMEDDMRLISRIKVHACFLGGASGSSPASTGGPSASSRRRSSAETSSRPAAGLAAADGANSTPVKNKTLGDFVNAAKMRTVLESCRRSYDDHRSRYTALQGDLSRLEVATDEIVRSVAGLVEHVEHELEDALDEIRAIVAEAEGILNDRDRLELDTLSAWQALLTLDGSLREHVTSLTHLKNDFTLQLHIHLHQISIQQSTIASLPPSMASLEELLISTRSQARTGFPHLARLHNMLHAYGAACIEVLWRKKVSSVVLDGAREMAEDVAEWLNREKARRKAFEGEVLTVLPYEIDLLGKAAKSGPRLELNATGGGEDIAGWQFGDQDLDGEQTCLRLGHFRVMLTPSPQL